MDGVADIPVLWSGGGSWGRETWTLGKDVVDLELSADNNQLNSVILTEIETTITIKCMLIVLATEIKRFGYVKYVAKEHAASSKAILKCH